MVRKDLATAGPARGWTKHVLKLVALALILLGSGCARHPPQASALDPANAHAPAAQESVTVQPLSGTVQTGAELIGEPQSRPAQGGPGGMMHGGHQGMMHGEDRDGTMAPTQSPAPTPEVRQYTCPMHPEVVQDHPGQCPKCGMNLVPRTEQPGRKETQP